MAKTEDIAATAETAASETRFSSVYRVLNEAIEARAFPGCAFGVLASDQIVVQDSLGHFTYENEAPPVRLDTVFDIASLTKVLATTAAAMLLCQRGVLDLETPLGELLPGFVVGRSSAERARHVTIRHLLAHNSGLPGYVELFRTAATPDALLRACLQLPLESEPGARAEYSDIGFILLGKALEVVTRESLASWVHREVFQPLGLRATGYNPAPVEWPLIPPTEEDTTLRERRIQGEVQDENAWRLKGVAGHAGLFSNVPDLLRFARVILRAGFSDAEKAPPPLFSKEIVEKFSEPQGPEGNSHALGWDTPSKNSSAGHHFSPHSTGHLGYSGCSLWIDLDAAVSVVLLTNRTWPDRKSQLIREVRPAFHDGVRDTLAASFPSS
ncbi:MAG: serine hydrolase domain-containing protein [Terracidiphilus sp.]